MEGSQVVRAAAIMYLVPLAFFLVGLYLGNLYASYIHRQDIAAVASAVLGFALLGLSYVLISQYSRGPAISQYRAKIIRIVSRDQD